MDSYYRHFIPHFAARVVPLTQLLPKGQPKRIVWMPVALHAFDDLENALSSEPVLHAVQPRCPVILFIDASGFGVGAVLAQETSQGERPVQ